MPRCRRRAARNAASSQRTVWRRLLRRGATALRRAHQAAQRCDIHSGRGGRVLAACSIRLHQRRARAQLRDARGAPRCAGRAAGVEAQCRALGRRDCTPLSFIALADREGTTCAARLAAPRRSPAESQRFIEKSKSTRRARAAQRAKHRHRHRSTIIVPASRRRRPPQGSPAGGGAALTRAQGTSAR